MPTKPLASLRAHFGGIDDPRIERSKRHQLLDILAIAICAVICGADTLRGGGSGGLGPDQAQVVAQIPAAAQWDSVARHFQ